MNDLIHNAMASLKIRRRFIFKRHEIEEAKIWNAMHTLKQANNRKNDIIRYFSYYFTFMSDG